MQRLLLIISLIFSVNPLVEASSVEELQDLLGARKYSQAIKAGELMLEQHPTSADVQFLTAYAYQMHRQTDRAEVLYQAMIQQHPELPEPRNNLALIYKDRGDYDAASKLLVDAIETHQSYATAYQNLSRLYTGIASEAYRRALSESKEPAKYTHKIELAALSRLEPVNEKAIPVTIASTDSDVEPVPRQADLTSLLKAQVNRWAKAWGNKDFASYTSFYSTEHRPGFETHSAWVEYRRQRIMRPGFIQIGVSDILIRAQNNNRAIIDFKQSFDSPSYSDRVVKRLGFRRIGSEWKIIDERVISVL